MQDHEAFRKEHPGVVVDSRPYLERRLDENTIIREFRRDVSSEELEWHMDRRDRTVSVLSGEGWQLQLENGLPFRMKPGSQYRIPRKSWHRILKGPNDLVIMIQEE